MMNIISRSHQPKLSSKLRREPGTVAVEFALVAPLLLVLLFGIAELGLLFKDLLILNNAAREGGRAGALGATTSTIAETSLSSTTGLRTEDISITQQYGTYDEETQTWTWMALGDNEDQNNAPAGAQVKITLSYPHTLVTAGLFPGLGDEEGGATVTLTAVSVMRRE